ncbi:hypothetical protein FHW22_000846|nr:hypothetical protein [Enterobacter ludwigii]
MELANWIFVCMYSPYFDLAEYDKAKKWGETTLRKRRTNIGTAPLIDLVTDRTEWNYSRKRINILTMLMFMENSVLFRIGLKIP